MTEILYVIKMTKYTIISASVYCVEYNALTSIHLYYNTVKSTLLRSKNIGGIS